MAGRVFEDVPALFNLPVPPYHFRVNSLGALFPEAVVFEPVIVVRGSHEFCVERISQLDTHFCAVRVMMADFQMESIPPAA